MLILACCLPALFGQATPLLSFDTHITIINHVAAGVSPTTAINMTGANFFVMSCGGNSVTLTPSDSSSNTWQTAVNAAGTFHTSIFYVENPTTTTTQTFTCTGTLPSLEVIAFANVAISTSFSNQNSSSSGSMVTTFQPGSVTPGSADQLVVSSLAYDRSATISINSGFIITDTSDAATDFGSSIAYTIQTGVAAVNPTWTLSTAAFVSAATATFKLKR